MWTFVVTFRIELVLKGFGYLFLSLGLVFGVSKEGEFLVVF